MSYRQMVNFPTWIPDYDSHSPGLLDFFLSSDASISSTMALPPLENSNHIVFSVSIDFPANSQRDAPFHGIGGWKGIFKFDANVYIPHIPPWFSAACAAAIAHRNHFFCLYQKDKSSASKVKFR